MSTENEGTAVPPAPSAPPVPVDSPAASPQPPAHHPDVRPPSAPASQAPQDGQASTADTGAPHPPHPSSAAAHDPAAPQGPGVTHSAPDASWPPPPPPGTPSYGDGGHGSGQYGDGQYGGGQYGGSGGQYGGGGWGASYQPPAPKAGRGRGGLVAALLIAALVAGGLGGGLGYTLAKNNDESGSTTVSASDTGGSVKRDAGTVAGVAAGALPSTVTIQAEGSNGEGGTGTGFVFDKQGHIVTNNHVVAEAVDGGKLSATFPDGKKYEAKVVGHAQGYDVAVIKLESAPRTSSPSPSATPTRWPSATPRSPSARPSVCPTR